jgi:hypothetical protein
MGLSGNGGSLAGGSAAPPATSGTLLPVDKTDGPGPYTELVKEKNVPPGGWLIYPKNIGMGGAKHPIFLWGPGAGTGPDTYDMKGHFDRWGSYGFVIYCPSMSTGDGTELKAGLDWLLKENESSSSALYQKLDTSKVAAGGHSQGSITTFAMASDPRLTTTIHISGGSFDGKGPDNLKHPVAYICGGADNLAGPNCMRDYENTKVPVYYSTMDGVDHVSAAREAWKKDFLDPTGAFQTGKFKAMTKNW